MAKRARDQLPYQHRFRYVSHNFSVDRPSSSDSLRITPTSGLSHLVRAALTAPTPAPWEQQYDAEGRPVTPRSPLRRSLQPLESLAERVRRLASEDDFSAAQPRRSGLSSSRRGSARGRRESGVDPDAPCPLLALPAELQALILEQLAFGELERLRRTCRFYRDVLSPGYVERLCNRRQALRNDDDDDDDDDDEGFEAQIESTCRSCLDRPGRAALIQQMRERPPTTQTHARTVHRRPVTQCFRCAVRAGDLCVGRSVKLATRTGQQALAWPCRWCGWPIVGPRAGSWANEQFHVECFGRYYTVLWAFLGLGFVQFAVGVVAAALGIRYFRRDLVVFAPVVVNFILLWVVMAFLILRGNRVRTYHWVGLLELAIMGLWIAPVYGVVRAMQGDRGVRHSAGAIAALMFFAVNIIFRFLNCAGNVLLATEYDMTRHHRPDIKLRRRVLNHLVAGLIFWTYPQCVEQKYPPDFH